MAAFIFQPAEDDAQSVVAGGVAFVAGVASEVSDETAAARLRRHPQFREVEAAIPCDTVREVKRRGRPARV